MNEILEEEWENEEEIGKKWRKFGKQRKIAKEKEKNSIKIFRLNNENNKKKKYKFQNKEKGIMRRKSYWSSR